MKTTHVERENWRTDKAEKLSLPIDRSFIWGFLAGVLITFIFTSSDVFSGDFHNSLAPEAVGIFVTVFVIDQLNKRQAIEQQKQEVILQMGSPDNGFALEAVRKLRHYGWLTDGALKGARLENADLNAADLSDANLESVYLRNAKLNRAIMPRAIMNRAVLNEAQLEGRVNLIKVRLNEAHLENARLNRAIMKHASLQCARLNKAKLQMAELHYANLQEAYLEETDLTEAELVRADLQRATLWETNLAGAQLEEANLKGAYLFGAKLQGAYLREANLCNARELERAEFDENTTLPNGDKWHEGYDLAIFTDPSHPEFFEPDWVKQQREQETKDDKARSE